MARVIWNTFFFPFFLLDLNFLYTFFVFKLFRYLQIISLIRKENRKNKFVDQLEQVYFFVKPIDYTNFRLLSLLYNYYLFWVISSYFVLLIVFVCNSLLLLLSLKSEFFFAVQKWLRDFWRLTTMMLWLLLGDFKSIEISKLS